MNDPLAQLQDIQLPQDVHQYPVALGWWLLLALIILSLVFALRYLSKRKKLNHAKKQALAMAKNQSLSAAEVLSIFKQAALVYWPRERVASIHSQGFATFLTEQLPDKDKQHFEQLVSSSFEQHYREATKAEKTQVEAEKTLQQGLVFWLEKALPPAHNLSKKNSTSGVIHD